MGVKAQFNSSTLKASYTAATSKAQVVIPANCQDINAASITVDFSGVVDCGIGGREWPSSLNAITFDAFEFVSGQSTPGYYCFYADTTSASPWEITLKVRINVHTGEPEAQALYAIETDNIAFANWHDDPIGIDTDFSNESTEGHCGTIKWFIGTTVTGYNGTADWYCGTP